MKNISIQGIIIALAVAIVIDFIGGVFAIPVFSAMYAEALADPSMQENNVYLYMLAASTVSPFLGGFMCAIFSKLAPIKNTIIFAVICASFSLAMGRFNPLWFDIAGSLLIMPSALLGAFMGAGKKAVA